MFERILGSLRELTGARRSTVCDDRWVVMDLETTGLDPQRAEIVSIGAVVVRPGESGAGSRAAVVLADGFDCIVRPDIEPGAANVVIHGIGIGRMRAGLPRSDALTQFVQWVGGAPMIGFHSSFDRRVLRSSLARERAAGGAVPDLDAQWLDLAELAPAIVAGTQAKALDDWLAHFGIGVAERHSAWADALASAELLLVLLARADRVSARSMRALQKLAADRRFVGPGR